MQKLPLQRDARHADAMRLGEKGLALLKAGGTLPQDQALVLVTGHLRAFGDSRFQNQVQQSWANVGFRSPLVALHTWDTAGSRESWWANFRIPQQAVGTSIDFAVRKSTLASSLLVHEVEHQPAARIQTPSPLLVARSCSSAEELHGLNSMLDSLNAQWYTLWRARWLLEQLWPGRVPPQMIVLKTRPDAQLRSRAGNLMHRAEKAMLNGSRHVWTCKGWHELGVSDIAFVTSYAALSALIRAYERCYAPLLESGAVPCRLLNKPELVLRLFLEALNFAIHDGAFDVRWCRNVHQCEQASEHIFNHSELVHVHDSARAAIRKCVRSSDCDGRAFLTPPASPAAPAVC